MSPLLIALLTISTCTLLIVLLFALKKREKKKQNPSPSQASSDLLNSLDFTIPAEEKTGNAQKPEDIIELVERFKFFQGKNLETFSSLLRSNNMQGIEQMIREKFLAQGEPDAEGRTAELMLKVMS